jgi:hypothetical protein
MEANEINEMDILSDMVTMYRNQITDSYLFMSNSLRLFNQYEQSTSSMINVLLEQRAGRRRQTNNRTTATTQNLRNESRDLINYLRSTRPTAVTARPPSIRTPRPPAARTVTNTDGNSQVSVNNRLDDNDTARLFTTIDNLIQSLTVDINALTPVVVAPTEAQINNATELIHYGNLNNPLNSRCPITLVDFTENDRIRQIIPCGHCFNNRALLRWFTTNCRCPVCRADIRDYNPVDAIRNPYSNNQSSTSTSASANAPTNNVS